MKRARQLISVLVVIAFFGAIAAGHLFGLIYSSVLTDALVNSLHAPGFAVVSVSIFCAFNIKHRTNYNYIYTALIAGMIAIFSEALQIPGPRNADIIDLISDGVGIICGLGVVAFFDRDLKAVLGRKTRYGLTFLAVISIFLTAAPTLWHSTTLVQQRLALPDLVTFEHRWESRISGIPSRTRTRLRPAPHGWPGKGDTVGHAPERSRDGIYVVIYPYPDWRGYSRLSFIAASDSDATYYVDLSIQDIRPNNEGPFSRYTERFAVGPSPVKYEIDLGTVQETAKGRPINMAHVRTIVLSAVERGTGNALLLDDFLLEP